MSKKLLIALFGGVLVIGGCGEGQRYGEDSAALGNLPLGLGRNYSGTLLVDGLSNPSFLAWRGDELTVCDSAAGRIAAIVPAAKPTAKATLKDLVTGFDTEYWKPGKAAEGDHPAVPSRFKIGPLSHVWLADGSLAVSEGGRKDSEDRIGVFAAAALNAGTVTAESGRYSNTQGKTTDNALDLGEGNLAGLAASRDGKTLWVCGHGFDGKTWQLSLDLASMKLGGRFAADDHGIKTNAPMDIFVLEDETLLVLYMGTGGAAAGEDGLIVHWDPKTGKPAAQWTLPGLIDPMGFDRIPGTQDFAVVDNNWSLEEVKLGRLARVSLPRGGGAAVVDLIGSRLMGPTACRFGKDRTLYVTELGAHFDHKEGRVIAIRGF